MLQKLINSLGASKKNHREREINWIGYSERPSRLVIEFTDGTTRTHLNVIPGYIVGLQVAADKLDYYESQIVPANVALEVSGARAIADTSTRASIHIRPGISMGAQSMGTQSMKARAAAPGKREAQS